MCVSGEGQPAVRNYIIIGCGAMKHADLVQTAHPGADTVLENESFKLAPANHALGVLLSFNVATADDEPKSDTTRSATYSEAFVRKEKLGPR